MNHLSISWRQWLLTLLIMASGYSFATETPTLEQLQADGRLQIKSWVEPAESIVVRQQVTLLIEVSTDTWFGGGTRIGRLELDNAIVLRRESFAVNSTRLEHGQTYTVQRWSISLYPQRPGLYEVPPLPLGLAIASVGGDVIEGQVMAPGVSFEVELPDALEGINDWVSTSSLRVEESYNRDLTDLKPGDAVQRQVTFSAENVAAMMLPELTATEQEGLGVYQKPPQIKDENNRGVYRARRTEAITYIIERPGSYRLPEQTFYWWDLDSQSLQQVMLPEQILEATGGVAPVTETVPARSTDTRQHWQPFAWLAALLLAAGLAWTLWRRRQALPSSPQLANQPNENQLQQQLQTALKQQDWPRVVQTLYAWLDAYGSSQYDGSIRDLLQQLQQPEAQKTLDQLMLGAYYREHCDNRDVEALIAMLQSELDKHPSWWRPKPIELKLN